MVMVLFHKSQAGYMCSCFIQSSWDNQTYAAHNQQQVQSAGSWGAPAATAPAADDDDWDEDDWSDDDGSSNAAEQVLIL